MIWQIDKKGERDKNRFEGILAKKVGTFAFVPTF
jgi:hypothetical protein